MISLYTACILVYFSTSVLAATLPLTTTSLLLLDSQNVNVSAPLGLGQLSSPHRPPSDPFVYIDPLSEETVRFYNYGVSLPEEDVVAVLSRAAREVAAHGSSQELIPDTIKRWGSGKVSLLLHHKNKMTWKTWKIALIGITDFVGRYEAVDMDFDVGQRGAKIVYGTGVLSLSLRDE